MSLTTDEYFSGIDEIKEKLDALIEILKPERMPIPNPDCTCNITAGIIKCPVHGFTGGFKGTNTSIKTFPEG